VTVVRLHPALAMTLAVTAVALSACGSSGPTSNGEATKSGPQVVKDAAAAFSAATAVRLVGTIADSESKQPLKLDLQMQSDGMSGSVTSSGYQLDLIVIKGMTYERAPAAFYTSEKAPAAVAAALGDHWVKLSSADSAQFSEFSLAGFAKSFAHPKQNTSPTEQKVTTGTLDGQKVVIVRKKDGSQLFLAATGKPLPVKIVKTAKSKDGAGVVTLSGYGKRQVLKAPAGAIDAAGLASGSSVPA
jgi:hypothetical protein